METRKFWKFFGGITLFSIVVGLIFWSIIFSDDKEKKQEITVEPEQEQEASDVKRYDLPNGNYVLSDENLSYGYELYSSSGNILFDNIDATFLNDSVLRIDFEKDVDGFSIISQDGEFILRSIYWVKFSSFGDIVVCEIGRDIYKPFNLRTKSFVFGDMEFSACYGNTVGKDVLILDANGKTYTVDAAGNTTVEDYETVDTREDFHFIMKGKTPGIIDETGKISWLDFKTSKDETVYIYGIDKKYIVLAVSVDGEEFYIIFDRNGKRLLGPVKHYLLGTEVLLSLSGHERWYGDDYVVVLRKNTYYIYNQETGRLFTTTLDYATAERYFR